MDRTKTRKGVQAKSGECVYDDARIPRGVAEWSFAQKKVFSIRHSAWSWLMSSELEGGSWALQALFNKHIKYAETLQARYYQYVTASVVLWLVASALFGQDNMPRSVYFSVILVPIALYWLYQWEWGKYAEELGRLREAIVAPMFGENRMATYDFIREQKLKSGRYDRECLGGISKCGPDKWIDLS
jgi:hypothetical protein